MQANANGTAGNGYAVQFIDDGKVTAGNETVNVDSANKTITVDIDSGSTTANDVINALNGNAQFAANFTASLNPNQPGETGLGVVDQTATATTAGGSGTNLDPSGLQIVNGGQTYNISFSGDSTVGDLLNTLNGSGAAVLAEINSSGTGINIVSRLSGSDFSIGENGGQTATQLGVRTLTGSTTLAQLNYGEGVQTATSGPDFIIQRPDGTQLSVSVASDTTIQDVINTINNDPNNQGANADHGPIEHHRQRHHAFDQRRLDRHRPALGDRGKRQPGGRGTWPRAGRPNAIECADDQRHHANPRRQRHQSARDRQHVQCTRCGCNRPCKPAIRPESRAACRC